MRRTGMQRRRQLAEGAPHLFRRLQIGLRSHGFDGQCRQVQAVSTALPEDTVGRRAAADRLENLVRQRVVRPSEAHRVGGDQRQVHPLRDRDQAAVDEPLRRVAMERIGWAASEVPC
jgi:hypothetical protein